MLDVLGGVALALWLIFCVFVGAIAVLFVYGLVRVIFTHLGG
ncbi:hypothetical protein [Ktedonospora formicarum]|uniref:Uncharacterized protein n=1 Tax=Ktedonospora formicarum TaxID=2778364 RepID=A0A8J3MRK2_9CHLR|nr:hypothetical protein [Ktedonospora formicarum]GHO45145.1 hypothetical protein KSX_33080 [Ktedonospora formicarum]